MALDPLTAGLEIGSKLIDHFFPDPAKKAEAYLELQKLQQSGDLAIVGYQADINKSEAQNPNLFVAGWRPLIGWVCGLGLASQFIIAPFAEWISAMMGHTLKFPPLDSGTLTTLLIGMLGLGGMRTIEKLQGVQDKH